MKQKGVYSLISFYGEHHLIFNIIFLLVLDLAWVPLTILNFLSSLDAKIDIRLRDNKARFHCGPKL